MVSQKPDGSQDSDKSVFSEVCMSVRRGLLPSTAFKLGMDFSWGLGTLQDMSGAGPSTPSCNCDVDSRPLLWGHTDTGVLMQPL